MRRFLIIFTILLVAYVAVSSPTDYVRLMKRPSVKNVFTRTPNPEQSLKTRQIGKFTATQFPQPLELTLRKGEYTCGNKVCKLEVGEKPSCPLCQYPI